MRIAAILMLLLLLAACGGGDWDCEENTKTSTSDRESAQWRMKCAAD